MSQRPLRSRAWYTFLHRITQLTAVLAYGIRYTGIRNIPQRGGVLVVSNHQSHFDPPLVGMGCHRRMNYLARSSLFTFGPFKWLIDSLDAIPIEREGIGLGGIKESLRRLKRGEIVVMFPEGTRTRDGNVGTFKPGFTTLARRSGAAILPVGIEGAFAIWPRWHKLPRLGPIHVHYGEPITPEEIAKLNEEDLLVEVHRRVRECHALLRKHPCFARRKLPQKPNLPL
jgi:1-acyl-sn-glycerol-3-phosphate acyltransferase